MPLEALPDDEWAALRRHAYRCAQFANHVMAEWYVALVARAKRPAYTIEPQDGLSDAVRGAVARECEGVWKRHRKLIARGDQRLPLFTADRALVVRERGVRMVTDEVGDYTIVLRLDEGRAVESLTRLKVWMPALERDEWLAGRLAKLVTGVDPITKATVLFERPGRKVFVLLTYAVPAVSVPAGQRRATLGPVEEDGALWMRIERPDGGVATLNYTGHVHRLLHMREHFDGIRRRLRMRTRRAGSGHKQAFRRALLRAGSFSEWQTGVLHEWSRGVVKACAAQGVGTLTVCGLIHQDLPMARLVELIRYKATDHGITISSTPDPEDPTTYRALAAPAAREGRSLGKQRKALKTLRDAVGQRGVK